MRHRLRMALFSAAFLILSFGLYFIFSNFLSATGKEIVKAWYHGQIVNLQEGQILPAIAKNQNLLENSPFLKAVIVIDSKIPEKPLFAIGQSIELSPSFINASTLNENVEDQANGFLSRLISAKLPGSHGLVIIYEVRSDFLIFSYLLSVAIGTCFLAYLIRMTVQVVDYERRKREDLRSDLLKRLAHDINSPLLTISSLSLKAKKLDLSLHQGLEEAAASIRNLFIHTDKIDKKLLSNQNFLKVAVDDETDWFPACAVITELISHKRPEFLSEKNLSFDLLMDIDVNQVIKINLEEFKRHLSNLLKNAVEATAASRQRRIEIRVFTRESSQLLIVIADSGRGIPKNILPKLGKKGFSFSKKNGKGLGLYFAIESIKQWSGNFQIESTENVGTEITITLPTKQDEDIYCSIPNLSDGRKLISIDDDKSIKSRWQDRLSLNESQLIHFSTPADFKKWYHSVGQFEDKLLFAFDYHIEAQITGLSIIDELGLAKESILVTSAYTDKTILNHAQTAGVKVLPKVLI